MSDSEELARRCAVLAQLTRVNPLCVDYYDKNGRCYNSEVTPAWRMESDAPLFGSACYSVCVSSRVDVAEVLAVAAEAAEADVDGCDDWAERLMMAVGLGDGDGE